MAADPARTRLAPHPSRLAIFDEPLRTLAVLPHRRRAGGGLPLHGAQLLRRSPGGAGPAAAGDPQDRQCPDGPRRGHPQEGRHRARRGVPGRGERQGALCRHRHPAEGEGRAAVAARRGLRRRAESPIQQPALAGVYRRAADVPGPRSPRWRALPPAGGHEGGGRQEIGGDAERHPQQPAGQAHPVLGRDARRTVGHGALPRPVHARKRPGRDHADPAGPRPQDGR